MKNYIKLILLFISIVVLIGIIVSIIASIPFLIINQLNKMKSSHPFYEPYAISDYVIIFNEKLEAKVNLTILDIPKKYEFYVVSLPKDAILLDLYDSLGKINNYTITPRNYTEISRTKNYTKYYQELIFTANDMNKSTIEKATIIFISNLSYKNSTPVFYDLDSTNIGFFTSISQNFGNIEVYLPDNFYFFPQKTDIRIKNYLISENKKIGKMRYINTNESSSWPSLTFIKNLNDEKWKIIESEKYIVGIENPSEEQINEIQKAERYFYILENITGFELPFSKLMIEVFDFSEEKGCLEAEACAGHFGFVIKPNAIKANTIIHESMHVFQFQIRKGATFKDPISQKWFDEGSATYAANLFTNLSGEGSQTKLAYEQLKEFYLSENKIIKDINFAYAFAAFDFAAYVQKCGNEALRGVFQEIGRRNEKSIEPISEEELIKIMGDSCKRNMTNDDLDFPYKNLLLTNESAFKEKVKNLVYMPPEEGIPWRE